MDKKPTTLAERVKIVREAMNLNQKDFAERINSSFRTVQSYESGKSDPKGKVLEILYDLGIDINWLLTGNGEMKRPQASEEYPLLTNVDLLESVIKTVDKFFSDRDFKAPQEFRDKTIIFIYRDLMKKETDLNNIKVGDYFSKILLQTRGE